MKRLPFIILLMAGGLRADIWNVPRMLSINQAVTATGSTTRTLVLSNSVTLTASLIVPGNIKLVIEKGGKIIQASTYIVTFADSSSFDAGPYKVFYGFNGTATKKVVFGRKVVTEVLPQWFGAEADGSHNDADAIQAATVAAGTGGTVRFTYTPDSYIVSKTITIDYHNMSWKGDVSGSNYTQIKSTGTVFTMVEVKHPNFQCTNLSFVGDGTGSDYGASATVTGMLIRGHGSGNDGDAILTYNYFTALDTGLVIRGKNCDIEDCFFGNTKLSVYIGQPVTAGTDAMKGIAFYRNRFHSVGGHVTTPTNYCIETSRQNTPIAMIISDCRADGPSSGLFSGNLEESKISGNEIWRSTLLNSIYLFQSQGVQISDNWISSNSGGAAGNTVQVDSSKNIQIDGNYLYHPAIYGIAANFDSNLVITNNFILNASWISARNYDGVYVSGNSDRIIINNNTIRGKQTGTGYYYTKYGINIAGTVTNQDIANNHIYDCYTASTNGVISMVKYYFEGWLTKTDSTLTLGTFPANIVVNSINCWVSEAFNASKNDTIKIGWNEAQTAYAIEMSAATTGVKTITFGSTGGCVSPSARAAKAYYRSTGTSPSTGKAHIFIEGAQATVSP